MKYFITFIFFQFYFIISAQDLKKDIVSNLNTLSHFPEDTDEFNLDSLATKTGKKLVYFLENNPVFSKGTIQNLDIISSKDNNIKIYTLSFDSNGTRGQVDWPIIQWKKNDGSYGAYELFPSDKKKFMGFEVSFGEIHKLPSKKHNLYLLLGTEKSNINLYTAIALVVEIRKNNLILDYPAFFGKSSNLGFIDKIQDDQYCIACIDYIEESNTLSIKDIDPDDAIGPFLSNSSVEVKEISTGKNFTLVFDGKKFISN